MKLDIVIVGVGGQGTLLSSKILGRLALSENLPVKVSEVHGMAQRGGSVITHVRIGEGAFAPLVSAGQADYVLAFEALEGARALGYLKPDGVMIVNEQEIFPMPVISGQAEYPHDALPKDKNILRIDAFGIAKAHENPRAVNIVLLGRLAALLDLPQQDWEDAIAASVPARTLSANLDCFRAGCALDQA